MPASMRVALLLATAAADFPLLPIAPPLTTLTNLKTDPTDVFVCSWPKSGTTWMQAIVAHLVEPDRSRWAHVSEVTPFYDVEASWDGDRPSQALTKHFAKRSRRCWNTHLLWSLIPKGGKYIYVVRDPADAVVSFWHHLRNQRGAAGTYEGTLPEFAAEISEGTQPYGAWSAHVSDWAAATRDPAVLIVRYADLKRDAAAVIRRVAAHLGVPGDEEIRFFAPEGAPPPPKPAAPAPLPTHLVACDVPPDARERILAHRARVRRRVELHEAELYGTGLGQPQIIEALAEEALERLLVDVSTEMDAALDQCSNLILHEV